MEHVSLDDAKMRLDELVDRVIAGETVSISEHGEVVARLVPVSPGRSPQPLPSNFYDELDRIARPQTESAGVFVRRMRDQDLL